MKTFVSITVQPKTIPSSLFAINIFNKFPFFVLNVSFIHNSYGTHGVVPLEFMYMIQKCSALISIPQKLKSQSMSIRVFAL